MKIAIVLNGEICSYKKTKELLLPYKYIIAVDGGLKHCHQMKISPQLIIGDFDSISIKILNLYKDIPLLKFPENKNESDLELALVEAKKLNPKSIVLFGALGKRTDHLLYTLNLVAKDSKNIKIISEKEILFYPRSGEKNPCFVNQTISLIPLSPTRNVTTSGLKWELKNKNLDKKFMSLSNICLKNYFTVNFESGDLLCCMQVLSNSCKHFQDSLIL